MSDTGLIGRGEELISLGQAAGRLPGSRGARRTHPATLTRWIRKGVRAASGVTVRLEGVRLGTRWLTTEPALARFAAALTDPAAPPPAPRPPSARERAAERAGEELARRGA